MSTIPSTLAPVIQDYTPTKQFPSFSTIINEKYVVTTLATGSQTLTPAQPDSARAFDNPLIVRFAILEFATVWLAYFAIAVGALDLTAGMIDSFRGESGFISLFVHNERIRET